MSKTRWARGASLGTKDLDTAKPRMEAGHPSIQDYYAACAIRDHSFTLPILPWQLSSWWAPVVRFGSELGRPFWSGLVKATPALTPEATANAINIRNMLGGDRATSLAALSGFIDNRGDAVERLDWSQLMLDDLQARALFTSLGEHASELLACISMRMRLVRQGRRARPLHWRRGSAATTRVATNKHWSWQRRTEGPLSGLRRRRAPAAQETLPEQQRDWRRRRCRACIRCKAKTAVARGGSRTVRGLNVGLQQHRRTRRTGSRRIMRARVPPVPGALLGGVQSMFCGPSDACDPPRQKTPPPQGRRAL